MSLSELLAAETARAGCCHDDDLQVCRCPFDAPASCDDDYSVRCGSTASNGLDFSFFDMLSPRSEVDRKLAPVISAVLDCECGDASAVKAARKLLPLLSRARQHIAAGATACSELNVVMFNRLVPRLVALEKYNSAARVLDMMAQDELPFTTMDDAWVLQAHLTPAVNVLQTLLRNKCSPKAKTLDFLFTSWLKEREGVSAAQTMIDTMCEFGGEFSPNQGEALVRTFLGKTRTQSDTSNSVLAICADNANGDASRTLERMLTALMRSSKVVMRSPAVLTMLSELEKGSSGSANATLTCRHLCNVLWRLCSDRQAEGRSCLCIRSRGIVFRMLVRSGHFGEAKRMLGSCSAEVDVVFMSSALHAVVAAAVAESCEHLDVNAGENSPSDTAKLPALLGLSTAVCALAAAHQTAQVPYSVLNQALTTLRACPNESTARVGVNLFEGLQGLHAKAVNKRTFDCVFELLFRSGESRGTSNAISDVAVSAVRRAHAMASRCGYSAPTSIAENLAKLRISMSDAPRRRVSMSMALPDSAESNIDIEDILPRSSSSEKRVGLNISGGAPARTRVAFDDCN